MCIFSRPVDEVGGTRIFARVEGPAQLLAYQMRFAAVGELAMVLPLPVAQPCREDAVRFLDLSAYAAFFDDLDRLFEEDRWVDGGVGAPELGLPGETLAVHEVGDFEASFVPTLADFGRLDRRFRVADRVWKALPGLRDHGFAVFKLKGGPRGFWSRLARGGGAGAPRKVHPMALRFPARDPGSLFFPTVHVHDGQVRPKARFDHALFCQAPRPPRPERGGFLTSGTPVERTLAIAQAQGLVVPAQPVHRMRIAGEADNEDVVARL